MSNTSLVVRNELTPQIWSMIREMAPVMHNSRLFGVASPEQAAAIMLKGHDLGLSVTAAFEFVQVVQGKPGLSPRGALAILHGSPEIEKITITRIPVEGAFEGYSCYMKRRNGFEYTARFTMADAQRAGLIKAGGGWISYPENLCMWRAVGFCADVVAPDLTAGMTGFMKMPEQFNSAIDNGGNIIEAQFTPVPPPEPVITLEQLLEKLTPEEILAANSDRMPETAIEVEMVARALGVL